MVNNATANVLFTDAIVLEVSSVRQNWMYANVKSRNGGVMTSWLIVNFRALASSGEYDFTGAEPLLLIPSEYVICPLVVRCTL